MKELYASIIGALIRFWDNRFVLKQCSACQILETEIARLRAENSSLVDRLLGRMNQPVQPLDDADSKLEVLHRAKKSWRQMKEELEAAHRRPQSDLAGFERDLELLEKSNVGN